MMQSYGAGPKPICYLLSLLSRWEEAIVLAIEEGSDGKVFQKLMVVRGLRAVIQISILSGKLWRVIS